MAAWERYREWEAAHPPALPLQAAVDAVGVLVQPFLPLPGRPLSDGELRESIHGHIESRRLLMRAGV